MVVDTQICSQTAVFNVAVLFEKRPSSNRWIDASWRATGLVVSTSTQKGMNLVKSSESDHDSQEGSEYYIYTGLSIRLFKDECESYYHNMKSPQPHCYVVAHWLNDAPEPFLATLSFDEAHAYLEGNEEVYEMPVPAELYLSVEAYVIEHYFPEKKRKRKLKQWHNNQSTQQTIHHASLTTKLEGTNK